MFNVVNMLAESSSGPINPDDILPKIIPTFWPFLVQLLAFLILFVAVFFLAYKPVKKYLKKRNDYIKNNIDTAHNNAVASEAKLVEADERINASYKEANVIVNQAKEDAMKEREAIIAQAQLDAKREKEKAEQEIALEVKKKEEEIHQEMVDVALLASEKILEREVNDKDNKKRVDNFIKDLTKDN